MYKTDVCSNLSSDVVRYCRLEWRGGGMVKDVKASLIRVRSLSP